MEKIQNNFLSPSIKNLSAGEGLAFYIGQLWKTLSVIGGLAFIIYFLLGGLSWLTAGGDKAKVESAQKQITNAVIGLAIILVSYAIILFIEVSLDVNILKPEFPNALWPSKVSFNQP